MNIFLILLSFFFSKSCRTIHFIILRSIIYKIIFLLLLFSIQQKAAHLSKIKVYYFESILNFPSVRVQKRQIDLSRKKKRPCGASKESYAFSEVRQKTIWKIKSDMAFGKLRADLPTRRFSINSDVIVDGAGFGSI